jgi:pimeloyl-ACP methyl ester carboxylesterase
MRVGPGRLYVPLTERLNALGYTVLRFDFFGLGDSEGELEEEKLADVYNNIEVGRYVSDTQVALRWLAETHSFNRFIVGGLCGGAITALLAAERDARVEGLLSLGMTVTLASDAAAPAKYLTRAQLDVRRRGYFQRLLQPKSWGRFLTFQSEYGVIWHSMKRLVVKERHAAVVDASAPSDQRGNANPLFPRAFFAFLDRGGKALMLFSQHDRLYSEYEEKFAEQFTARLQPLKEQVEKHVISDANHVLSFSGSRRAMVDLVERWLSEWHCAAPQ